MKVITISGHAQNGKDISAVLISDALKADNNRVLITHYADLLKYICRTYLGWNGIKDESGRTLLQSVGTDIVRKKNPDYWVDFTAFILESFYDLWDYVIIPDTRFPNEITVLKDKGFDVAHLKIVRPGFENKLTSEQKEHSSETALDNMIPDYCIKNDGTLKDLSKKLKTWVKESLYE